MLLKIKWKSTDKNEIVRLKAIVNTIDTDPVGVTFGGILEHNDGINETVCEFDTSYLVAGKYTVDFILYDQDEEGNVGFHDRVTALRFSVERGENGNDLKHWFSSWGYAVLPCMKTDSK